MRNRTLSIVAAAVAVSGAIMIVKPWPSKAESTAQDQVLIGAGDIASCRLFVNSPRGHTDTASMLKRVAKATIFTAGDNSQDDGTSGDYTNCYAGTGSWGDPKTDLPARTRPSMGNHDYRTNSGSAYYSYFNEDVPDLPTGEKRAGNPIENNREGGYYSYNLGAKWHVVVLNSNLCDPDNKNTSDQSCDGVNDANDQYSWLKKDLEKHKQPCTVAYWHHPLFTSGASHKGTEDMRPLYQLLYDKGAEVVMNGHNHVYERFDPQNAQGQPVTNGIRQFGVGTGGTRTDKLASKPAANSVERKEGKFGLLQLTLHDGDKPSYEWKFTSTDGSYTDQGGAKPLVTTCH